MQEPSPEKKFRIPPASKMLQAKAGTGPLNEKTVELCQLVMDTNETDFAPLALEYLQKLEEAIKSTQQKTTLTKECIQSITTPVMQLKANASIFKYNLIGSLANVMLSFLESITELDNNALSIVIAHHQTLKAIIQNKLKGDGGAAGQQMETELKAACERYFAHKK